MKTTATHRVLARQYAADLNWAKAAFHMREAIAVYPAEDRPGSLAARDLAQMRRSAEAWERQAKMTE